MHKGEGSIKPLISVDGVKIEMYTQMLDQTGMSEVYPGYSYTEGKMVVVRSSRVKTPEQNKVLSQIASCVKGSDHTSNLLLPWKLRTLPSDNHSTYLITPLCNNGTLHDLFEYYTKSERKMSFQQAVYLTVDLLTGFYRLVVQIGIKHKDIKEKNVFLHDGYAMLGDYNRSQVCKKGQYDEDDLVNLAKICLKIFHYVDFRKQNDIECFESQIKPLLFRIQEGVFGCINSLQKIIANFLKIPTSPRQIIRLGYSPVIKRAMQTIFLYRSTFRELSVINISNSQISVSRQSLFKTCIDSRSTKTLVFCQFLLVCAQQISKQFNRIRPEDDRLKSILEELLLKYEARILLVVETLLLDVGQPNGDQMKSLHALTSILVDMKTYYNNKAIKKNWTYLVKIKNVKLENHFLAITNITKKLLAFAKLSKMLAVQKTSKGLNYLLNTLNCSELQKRVNGSSIRTFLNAREDEFILKVDSNEDLQNELYECEIVLTDF